MNFINTNVFDENLVPRLRSAINIKHITDFKEFEKHAKQLINAFYTN